MARNGHEKTPQIKRYRLRKKLTQQELADRLGIDRATLVWLESTRSARKPGRRLANIIGGVTRRSPGQVLDEYDRLRKSA